MTPRQVATVVLGAVGGLTACALSLQASGVWQPTDAQASDVVAVAAATASVATVRGAVDRYQADIVWRRWRGLAISMVIALGSALAAVGLALVASRSLALGSLSVAVLIGVAAATAFAGAVLEAYKETRAVSDQEKQRGLENVTSRLLARVLQAIEISPPDVEVVLLLKARNVIHPSRRALRVVHTQALGRSREHPHVIHERKQADGASYATDSLWKCYRDEVSVAPPLGETPYTPSTSRLLGRVTVLSTSTLGVWGEPVRNNRSKVVGVLALLTYATFTGPGPGSELLLSNVTQLAALAIGNLIASDY